MPLSFSDLRRWSLNPLRDKTLMTCLMVEVERGGDADADKIVALAGELFLRGRSVDQLILFSQLMEPPDANHDCEV
jgi:hypothetical protein